MNDPYLKITNGENIDLFLRRRSGGFLKTSPKYWSNRENDYCLFQTTATILKQMKLFLFHSLKEMSPFL